MTVQIVEIAGQKMAVLPIVEYQQLLDAVELQADVLAAVRAEERREAGEEYLPAEMVDRILGGESSLRVWRQHRKMTLEKLAVEVGIRKSFLSEIETGKARGAPALWRRLAEALNVSADDILPLD
jgi:DNA-binding XRE family transcriptional regulator